MRLYRLVSALVGEFFFGVAPSPVVAGVFRAHLNFAADTAASTVVVLAMKSRPAAVIFILVTVTLDILAMGLIIPVLPKLILDFLGGEMTDAAKWSARFAVVFALMQFFFSPLLGVLSDRFGRRPIILLSNLGLGLDYIVMAMAPTLSWLFLGRIISGITTSSIPTAMAYIADVTPKEKRAGAFGLIGVAFGVGFTFGPLGLLFRSGILGAKSAKGIQVAAREPGRFTYAIAFSSRTLATDHNSVSGLSRAQCF